MAQQLDELNPHTREEGLDVNVITKRIPAEVGKGSLVFEIILWVLGIIPGLVFLIMKIQAKNYFQQLEQKIQANASQIDNYLEQRVMVLQNCARLLDKAIALDKDTYETVAMYRSGGRGEAADAERNAVAGQLDSLSRSVNIAFESYPELKSGEVFRQLQSGIADAEEHLQAARRVYNANVAAYNTAIVMFPASLLAGGRTAKEFFEAESHKREDVKMSF